MKSLRKSKLLVTGLALGFGTFACSIDPRPARHSVISSPNVYNGDEDGSPTPSPSPTPVPSTPASPAPSVGSGDVIPDPVVDPSKGPLNVAVSLNSTTVAEPGESLFGRGTRLTDGSLVMSFLQSANGFQTIQTEISFDEGKSWQSLGQVMSVPFPAGAPQPLFDPAIAALPSGTLMVVNRTAVADGTFRLQATVSRDRGRSWSFQGDIDVSPNTAGQSIQPAIHINSRGQAQVIYTKSRNPTGGDEQILMKTSTDEGRTWINQTIVASRAVGNSSFGAITRLKDNSLLVAFDTFRGDTDNHLILRYVQSNNDGLTWTAPRDLYVPANGEKNAQSPQITILEDGRPVVVFMSNEEETGQPCCTIKMMMTQNVPSFNRVVWQPQAITAIAANALLPSALPVKDSAFMLSFERERKVLMNRVSIKGGL